MCFPQNYYVWESGEPAFIKWYVRQPATLLGGAALQREEGLQQYYVAGAIEAYLAECGVAMSRCGASRLLFRCLLDFVYCSGLMLQLRFCTQAPDIGGPQSAPKL